MDALADHITSAQIVLLVIAGINLLTALVKYMGKRRGG